MNRITQGRCVRHTRSRVTEIPSVTGNRTIRVRGERGAAIEGDSDGENATGAIRINDGGRKLNQRLPGTREAITAERTVFVNPAEVPTTVPVIPVLVGVWFTPLVGS